MRTILTVVNRDGIGTALAAAAIWSMGGLQWLRLLMIAAALSITVGVAAAVPSFVDITWMYSFDTATWSRLTGARIIGSKTTCFQAIAERLPARRCTPVDGGETIPLADGVTMRVVRWNHSGDSATNPEQHTAVELNAPPTPDSVTGGFRAGVADDFPNGGGGRAYLFTVDASGARLSWFFQDSASPVDLHVPIVVDGRSYGAPLDNLTAALKQAGITSVDLWIGTGGRAVAQLVLPLLKPRAYLPVHWDGLYGPFEAGVARRYRDDDLQALLAASGVTLVTPIQYMDKWRLDHRGMTAVPNETVKQELKLP